MARAVKRQEKFLICPGQRCWELWELSSSGNSRLVERNETLSDLPLSRGCVLALPTQYVYSLCVWLLASDPAILPDMVFAQMEKHGLMSRIAEETVHHWKVITTEEMQTLVSIIALPHT